MKMFYSTAFLAVAMTFTGAALANDTLEATFGNTVTVVSADGTLLASYHMSADGTFHVVNGDGTDASGTWREDVDAHQVCLTPADGEEACSDLNDGLGVGDSWTADDGDGGENTMTIVAGM